MYRCYRFNIFRQPYRLVTIFNIFFVVFPRYARDEEQDLWQKGWETLRISQVLTVQGSSTVGVPVA